MERPLLTERPGTEPMALGGAWLLLETIAATGLAMLAVAIVASATAATVTVLVAASGLAAATVLVGAQLVARRRDQDRRPGHRDGGRARHRRAQPVRRRDR